MLIMYCSLSLSHSLSFPQCRLGEEVEDEEEEEEEEEEEDW